jgi:hypothetical protein
MSYIGGNLRDGDWPKLRQMLQKLAVGGLGPHSIPTFGGLILTPSTGASGQLTSNVADGTAPFIVTSTTLVSNLNADLLDGQEASYFAVAANYLALDQTTPQNITGGQPDFNAGLRAGSTDQLSIDASGDILTTGTLGAGAITGTSLTANNITINGNTVEATTGNLILKTGVASTGVNIVGKWFQVRETDDGNPAMQFTAGSSSGNFALYSGGVQTIGFTGSTGQIWAGGDIWTTGAGDDFWLGNVTQASASFQAYANGNLIAKGISQFGVDANHTRHLSDRRYDVCRNCRLLSKIP